MKPQKALHMYIEKDKKKPKYIGHAYMLFQKYDGWYGYLEGGKIYSRAGRLIPSLQHLNMPHLSSTRLLFEILVNKVPEFHLMNGILNRKERCNAAYFKVHDMIVPDDTRNFAERFGDLHQMLKRNPEWKYEHALHYAAPLGVSNDPLIWQQAAEKVWSIGGEGVILKRVDAPYDAGKRNCNLMKIKEECTVDLLVVGMAMGEGKYHSTLGKLILRDKSGKEHRVSGMTDTQRDEWWRAPKGTIKCPHPIMGRVVEVKAMKQLKDGSLREPRFKAIRYDKLPMEID